MLAWSGDQDVIWMSAPPHGPSRSAVVERVPHGVTRALGLVIGSAELYPGTIRVTDIDLIPLSPFKADHRLGKLPAQLGEGSMRLVGVEPDAEAINPGRVTRNLFVTIEYQCTVLQLACHLVGAIALEFET